MGKPTGREFVRDNLIVLIGSAITYLKAFILMPIIIKTAGVEVYGGYVLLNSLLSITFGISSMGVGITARRYMPSCKTMVERGRLFYPQLIFGFLSIVVLSLLFAWFGDYINLYLFDGETLYSVYLGPLYLIAYLLYAQGVDYFRFTSRLHWMTLGTAVFPYLHISLITFALYYFGHISINILVLTEVLSAVFIGLLCFYVILRELGWRIKLFRLKELLAELKLGIPLMLNVVIEFILSASDRYLILIFMTVTAVGNYAPGYILGSVMMVIPKAMSTAIPQLMSKAIDSGESVTAQRMFNYTIKLYLLLSIPFIFGSYALAKDILILLTNPEISEAAYLITPIVAVGMIFYGLNYLTTIILIVELKTQMLFRVNLLAASVNLIMNLVLLYLYRDIMMAAFTTVACYFIAFVYLRHKVKAIWPVHYDIKFIAKVIVASAAMLLFPYPGPYILPVRFGHCLRSPEGCVFWQYP